MARKLRPRRGNTAQNNAYTGAAAEITIDTTKKTLVVHDGATAGGSPLPTHADVTATISSLIGVPSGVAGLDAGGKVPSAQLPSYVDDVLEYADYAALPATGETGKIYITQDTGASYRWTGTVYLKLSDDDVLEFANLAAFPVSGVGAALYIAADTGLVYRWDGAAYAAVGLQPIADQTLLGNVSGSTATPVALTKAQAKAFVQPSPQLYKDDAPAIANVIGAGTKTRAYVWGSGNYIGNSSNSVTDCAILAGTGNSINSSVTSTTGDGIENVIAGGRDNWMGGGGTTAVYFCTIGGGLRNRIFAGNRSAILNGTDNAIGSASSSGDSVVVGGQLNTITTGDSAFIGGGVSNTSNANYSAIAGGYDNTITAVKAFIGGGNVNANGSINGTISGGNTNTITAVTEGFIGGGFSNTVSAAHGTIAGGYDNNATAAKSTVVGGEFNTASGAYSLVGGGQGNTASGTYASVLGGVGNAATADYSIALGYGANTQSRKRTIVESAGAITTSGDVQVCRSVLRGQTTSATPLRLAVDGEAISSGNTLSSMTYQLLHIKGRCIARAPGNLGDYAIWEFTALMNQNNSVASQTLLAAVSPTLVSSGGTGNTWALAVTADTSFGSLNVTATGEAAKTITWGCALDVLEVRDIS